MTQGIRINGDFAKSKKAVKEAVEAGQSVRLVATSWHGDEYDGPVVHAPVGRYSFVGPDEHNKRNFYGTVEVKANGTVKVT